MSARKILSVTAILAAAGAICGALSGALVGFIVGVVRLRQPVEGAAMMMLTGAGGGAILGAVLAPITGWVLLRHVPIGRAMGYATLGTMAGATVGLLAARDEWWLGGGLIGFTLTAIWLRLSTKSTPRAADSTPAPEDSSG